jgi:hypothetical protein
MTPKAKGKSERQKRKAKAKGKSERQKRKAKAKGKSERQKQIPHHRSPNVGDRVRDDTKGERQRQKQRQNKKLRAKADPSPPFAEGGRPGSG